MSLARHRLLLVSLMCAAVATTARAQSPEDPRLEFTTFGGYIGNGSLWQVNQQVSLVTASSADTLTLGRDFKTGFALGLGIQLYRSPHVGYQLEMAFLGTTTEGRCRLYNEGGAYAYDSDHVNQQACEDIQGSAIRTNAVSAQLGVIWRALTRGAVQPYLRAALGPAILGGSYVETKGVVGVPVVIDTVETGIPVRVFLTEKDRRELTWTGTLALGSTLQMAPGYQLRFEVRDVILNVPTATGPANPLDVQSLARTGHRTVHLPSLTVGFDIVLERQRRRRY